MRSACIGAIAVLLSATSALAQEAEDGWEAAMSRGAAAYNADDFEAALTAFEQAVGRASAPVEQAEAMRALGVVRFAQGRTSDALAVTEQAISLLVELVDADDPDAIEVSKSLWDVREAVFRADGKDDEAHDARFQSVRLLSRLGRPGWRADGSGGVTHFLTGFTCPAEIEGLPRFDFTTYVESGVDVGCSYDAGDGAPLEASVDAMQEEIETVYGNPRVVEDDTITRSDGVTVRRVIYARGKTELPHERSAGWLADTSGWTHKVRISWSEPIEQAFVEKLADALAVESTRGVFVGECAPATKRAEESHDPTAALAHTIALTNLLYETGSGGEAEEPAGGGKPAVPWSAVTADACLIGSVSLGGDDVVVRRLRTSEGGVTHVAAPLTWRQGDSWLGLMAGLPLDGGEPTYVVEHAPDRSVIWATLDGQPSDEQLLEIVSEIVSGERTQLSSVRRTDDGAAITYNPDRLE